MTWEIEATDEFSAWYRSLDDRDQEAVTNAVDLLEQHGPELGRPHVDHVKASRHSNMKELRVQSGGKPLRAFFAFDPRRVALLLIAGDKTGYDRFYERMIPRADALYVQHLAHLEECHAEEME